jgi:hypothetical protein
MQLRSRCNRRLSLPCTLEGWSAGQRESRREWQYIPGREVADLHRLDDGVVDLRVTRVYAEVKAGLDGSFAEPFWKDVRALATQRQVLAA